MQLGVVQICTKKDQDLEFFANLNSFFNEMVSAIFCIFMDSELPSAWCQHLLNKFVAFYNLLLGWWQQPLSRSLESNMSWPIFWAIYHFFRSSFSSLLLDFVRIHLWSFHLINLIPTVNYASRQKDMIWGGTHPFCLFFFQLACITSAVFLSGVTFDANALKINSQRLSHPLTQC